MTSMMSYFRNLCLRDGIVKSIMEAKRLRHMAENYKNTNDGYDRFLDTLREYIKTLDEDMEDYSSSKMKILMELNGFDIDESYRFLMKLKTSCVDNRIGIIDIRKPIDLDNVYVAIVDF